MTTRRGRIALVTVATSLAALAGATAQHWDPYARECRTIDLAENADASALLARGWFGDPNDHAERLYAPACRVQR